MYVLVFLCAYACECVCALCVCVCVRACVHACVCVCTDATSNDDSTYPLTLPVPVPVLSVFPSFQNIIPPIPEKKVSPTNALCPPSTVYTSSGSSFTFLPLPPDPSPPLSLCLAARQLRSHQQAGLWGRCGLPYQTAESTGGARACLRVHVYMHTCVMCVCVYSVCLYVCSYIIIFVCATYLQIFLVRTNRHPKLKENAWFVKFLSTQVSRPV